MAVVCLVVKSKTKTEVEFVASKTRVAPLQLQTIPRLELLSAFLLAKLVTVVLTIYYRLYRLWSHLNAILTHK